MPYFNSRRSSVVARNGIVATSQPLAAQVGIDVLKQGGNAVDAAVATAAALNVLEPMSTGIGGDMFALVWMNDTKKVVAVNGSGRSASAANTQDVKDKGYSEIPNNGPHAGLAVSVPGTVDGWQTCLDKFGQMSMAEVLKPAIKYAKEGFAVSQVIANAWKDSAPLLSQRKSGTQMLPGGKAPNYGEIVKFPELAKSLDSISKEGPEAFYKGDIARKISEYVQSEGGWLTTEDLSNHSSSIDIPISTDYRGVTIWECPPNGSGIAALMALNIAEGFDLSDVGPQSVDRYHLLIESMRLSYEDSFRYVADPRVSNVPVEDLLSKKYASERRSLISSNKAIKNVSYGNPNGNSDTVYLSVIDGDGNACSFINSLFSGFGTGLVVPDTGIALQNRGSLFSMDPNHPNYLEGNKRPYQTIIPAMATRNEELWLSFGVMGGFQQPQGQLQVISNMVDHNMDSQEALDSLRFSVDVDENGHVLVESDLDQEVVKGLRAKGHDVTVVNGYDRILFGGGQIISRDSNTGLLTGGSEPRKDGAAIGY